jgi:hypothetical protein
MLMSRMDPLTLKKKKNGSSKKQKSSIFLNFYIATIDQLYTIPFKFKYYSIYI